jgi:enoyl-CoA hydratase/3-hydroxyacyl-CoA dehydrogenase
MIAEPLHEIREICFVGAGTMGCYNALAAAVCGYPVVLFDASDQSLAAIPQRQEELAAMLVGAGWCSEQDISAALARTRVVDDLAAACARADLVSESVFEDLELKRRVHGELDALCGPNTILTSNSSALLVSDIESAVENRERFAALHSHLGSPLVDIVPGSRTSPEVIELLNAYVLSLRGVPLVLKKENPGYVLNAMLGNVLGTALALVVGEEGCSVETVDAAWLSSQQGVMGPFGMMDLFGLSVIRDSWQHRDRDDALQALRPQVMALMASKFEQGAAGMKAGAGFYRYPNPAYAAEEFQQNASGACIQALQTALLVPAIQLVRNDVVSREQVDMAWTVGMHLPRGPFEQLSSLDTASVRQALAESVERGLLLHKHARAVEQWLVDERVAEEGES